MDDENEGSLLLGAALGFFLGCLGIVIAFLLKGRKTLTGSIVGLVAAIAMWTCASIGLVVLQVLLTSS